VSSIGDSMHNYDWVSLKKAGALRVRISWVVSQGVKPGGYLETLSASWSSWSHSALRLPGEPMLEPWKGSGTT
jgi:hypothetical protein